MSTNYLTTPSYAGPNQDYQQIATPNPLIFGAGSAVTNNPDTSSQVCFNVPIINDMIVDPNEFFDLGLASASGLIQIDPNRVDSSARVTIDDDDIGEHLVFSPNIGSS